MQTETIQPFVPSIQVLLGIGEMTELKHYNNNY